MEPQDDGLAEKTLKAVLKLPLQSKTRNNSGDSRHSQNNEDDIKRGDTLKLNQDLMEFKRQEEAERKKIWCKNIVVESRNIEDDSKPQAQVQRQHYNPMVKLNHLVTEVANDFIIAEDPSNLATQLRSMPSYNDERAAGERQTSMPDSRPDDLLLQSAIANQSAMTSQNMQSDRGQARSPFELIMQKSKEAEVKKLGSQPDTLPLSRAEVLNTKTSKTADSDLSVYKKIPTSCTLIPSSPVNNNYLNQTFNSGKKQLFEMQIKDPHMRTIITKTQVATDIDPN